MSALPKILFVIDSLDRCGLTHQLDVLSLEVIRQFEVHVVILNGEPPPQNFRLNEAERQLHYLGRSPQATMSGRAQIQASWKLKQLIQRLNPEILHAWGHIAERAMLGAAQQSPARKFVTAISVRPSTHMTAKAFDQWIGKSVKRYVVPHDEVKKSLVAHQYPEGKISVIANAISPVSKIEHARRKLIQIAGAGEQVRIAGAIAPLVPRSRLKDLIWATDLLTCIRNDFHFFIFGRGSQRKRLEKFASQTEAGDHVHFVDSEMTGLQMLHGFDYFWQSHLNEPLPTAMTAAMSSGIPVISVFGPGTSELIEHQETGFATNFGARDEFARWTKFLLEKPKSAEQLARQGNDSLAGKFPVDQMVDQYLAVYDS